VGDGCFWLKADILMHTDRGVAEFVQSTDRLARGATTKGLRVANHEQALIDIFHDHLRLAALAANKPFHPFSLDGQDRDTADYLLSDADRFSLVEYKWDAVTSEGRKHRRLNLCKALEQKQNLQMRNRHDRCHFLTWQEIGSMRINIYRHEVCNQMIFGKAGLPAVQPHTNTRVTVGTFTQEFLKGNRSLTLSEFEDYLAWLLAVSEARQSSLELLIDRREMGDWLLVRTSSLDEAATWVRNRFLASAQPRDPDAEADTRPRIPRP
jgi:hypothetical protein